MQKKELPKISIIIPVFNEEKVVQDCIISLKKQSYKNIEIIVVDDGSSDNSLAKIYKLNPFILKQNHLGPGSARNLGAKSATGKILVFVDADMQFDKDFITDLTKQIIEGSTIGTFSKNEFVSNFDNIWARCWNLNRNIKTNRMLPKDYPDLAPVFRAILKSEFDKVNGFETSGDYTDDWSLSKKLNIQSMVVVGAKYYHSNPATLSEVWEQARWIGKNQFLTGNISRRIKSLVFYSFPISVSISLYKSIINICPEFIIFKITYDLAVMTSVIVSFVSNNSKKK